MQYKDAAVHDGPAVEQLDRSRGWPLILALAATLAFLPALGHDFVVWDDESNFISNLDFGALSRDSVRWAWTTFRAGVYHPLAWMFLEAQASLWGLDARGYHAVSVLLHCANTLVLYRLVRALLDRCSAPEVRRDRRTVRAAAALATLLFAVHPLRVEVVAWASCQPHLLSMLCAMLATLAYLRAHPEAEPTSARWAALAWLGYSSAVLSKVEPVTLPLAFLILDVYPLRRLGPGRWLDRDAWREKVPYAASGLAVAVLAILARGTGKALRSGRPYDLPSHLAQACYAAGFYPVKTVWPAGLSIFYGMPERIELTAWPFWPAALAVTLASLGAFLVRRRWPGVAAAWAVYLVLVSPHLGFVPSGPVIAADRYSYLASIPWIALLAGGLARLLALAGPARIWILSLVLGLAAWLGGMSWNRCHPWGSSEVLFRLALDRGGGRSPELRSALGLVLLRSRRLDEATALYEEALRMDPEYFQAHFYLGNIRARQGRLAEAEDHFAAAVRIVPDDRDAHFNLAVALSRRGEHRLAIRHYERALKIRPMAETAFNLAVLLSEQGRMAEAVDRYELAVRLEDDPRAHNNLGAILLDQGRFAEAEGHFRRALRLRPDYPQARAGLDLVREKLNRRP
jgi:protein O-mannosyl-transferase